VNVKIVFLYVSVKVVWGARISITKVIHTCQQTVHRNAPS
jgi:hypothetical protein